MFDFDKLFADIKAAIAAEGLTEDQLGDKYKRKMLALNEKKIGINMLFKKQEKDGKKCEISAKTIAQIGDLKEEILDIIADKAIELEKTQVPDPNIAAKAKADEELAAKAKADEELAAKAKADEELAAKAKGKSTVFDILGNW